MESHVRSVRGLAVAGVLGGLAAAFVAAWAVGRTGSVARLTEPQATSAAERLPVDSSVDRGHASGLGATADRPSLADSDSSAKGSSSEVPNARRPRIEPVRLQDVTASLLTGGHWRTWGAWITDWDCEGDLDVRAILGGVYPGNHFFNELAQSPEIHTHWLKIKLVAATSNRLALGAKIQVELKGPDGEVLFIRRTIGNNGSFGGNALVELVGLGAATYADQVIVSWPISRTTDRFHKVDADQLIEITEGGDSYRVIEQKSLAVPTLPPR
jgi:hypothetical protein